MSPEDRDALAEICSHTDQWTEEILARLPRWSGDRRLRLVAESMEHTFHDAEQVEDPTVRFLMQAGAMLGLIGLSHVLEVYHRREEGEID